MTRRIKAKDPDLSGLPPRIRRVIDKYQKLLPVVERMASFPLLNPNPIFEVDLSGKVTFHNRACLEALKRHRAGKDIRAFLPPDFDWLLRSARQLKRLQLTRRVRVKDAVFAEGIHAVPRYRAIRFYLRDITERVRTEEYLRESETKYRIIADKTYDFEFWIDPRGNYIYCSPSCRRITGYPARDFFRDKQLRVKIVHPNDRRRFLNHLRNESGKKPSELEFRIVRKDGNVRWIHHVCQPVLDRDGDFLGIRGSNRDVTLRKQSDLALHENEERFKSLFNELPLSTVVFQKVGADFMIRDYNRASDAFLGHKMVRFTGRPARELFAIRPEVLKKFDLVVKTKKPQALRIAYRIKRTGRRIDLNLTIAFIPPDRIIVHSEDITERKGKEDQLRFQARILGAVKDAVIVSDPDFRITQWNRAAERIYGWRAGEVLGKTAKDVLRSEMSNRERDKLYRRLQRGRSAVTELVQYTKDSRPLVIDGYTIPMKNLQGEITNYVAINHDITERKRYEEELKTAKKDLERRVRERTAELERARSATEGEKQRFYDVLETLPVYVVLLAKDYRVPFANKFFRDRFGESRGRRCYEYLFKRKSPCAVCESFKVFKDGQARRWEWTGPDGRNYDIYDFPFRDSDGTRLVMEMGIDITEQKRAQSALRQANEYHRTLLEASLDPLVTISAEGKITDANEAAVKATGRPRRELIGTDFSNYFTDPEKAREGYQRVFARGFVADYPLTIRHRGGGLMDVLYNASVYRDEQGRIIGVFAAARDITVLKQAEEELKKHRDHLEELVKEGTRDLLASQERLQRAEAIAHLGSWELNLVEDRLSWTDEVYRIFGLNPQGFKATYPAFLECVHPEDREAVDAAYSGSVSEGRPGYEIEHRIVRQDSGEIRWVHERCEHQRDERGRVVRSVGMVHDITERKRAENDMRSLNLRLEDINEQLKDFVFTVSHDLKAPLRTIQGYCDALMEDYAGKLDPAGRTNIERIAGAVQRLDTMIQDLLAYSRLSSEQIVMETVDLDKVVREIIERLKPEISLKKATVTAEPGLPPAGGQLSVLHQVVENLILNAVTYVKPGVEPEVRIWSETHGEWVYLYFKDNGIGIAAENQERIFKVFERLHGVESYPGTGVGLAIVKKGIERMGGKLGLLSSPGEGSTFWIALPRVDLAKVG